MLTTPAPRFGEHNHEVLLNARYNDKDIEEMITEGVISNKPADLNIYIE